MDITVYTGRQNTWYARAIFFLLFPQKGLIIRLYFGREKKNSLIILLYTFVQLSSQSGQKELRLHFNCCDEQIYVYVQHALKVSLVYVQACAAYEGLNVFAYRRVYYYHQIFELSLLYKIATYHDILIMLFSTVRFFLTLSRILLLQIDMKKSKTRRKIVQRCSPNVRLYATFNVHWVDKSNIQIFMSLGGKNNQIFVQTMKH